MIFKTTGDKFRPTILYFHAMGVTGDSSMSVAENLTENYYCIMPTSTVYCTGQTYCSKQDEVQQITKFLEDQGIEELALVIASSIGADLAMAFLTSTKIPVKHVFFDGGQFARIGKQPARSWSHFQDSSRAFHSVNKQPWKNKISSPDSCMCNGDET